MSSRTAEVRLMLRDIEILEDRLFRLNSELSEAYRHVKGLDGLDAANTRRCIKDAMHTATGIAFALCAVGAAAQEKTK